MSLIAGRKSQRVVNLDVQGRLRIGGAQVSVPAGQTWFISPAGNDTSGDGLAWDRPFATFAKALTKMVAFDHLYVAPGKYDEQVTIPRSLGNIVIIGSGGRGAAFIEPSAANGIGLTNHGRDVTLINLGCAGNGTGAGLVSTGRRLRADGCKFEAGGDGADAVRLSLGTVAQIDAATRDKGDDTLFEDCEIAYALNGVLLTGTDFGAVTQNFFKHCYFHSLSASSFSESTGTGGSIGVRFRGLLVEECVFGAGNEDVDALPTKWFSLNGDNANDGLVTRCTFPAALNSTKNLVSTTVLWVGNLHPLGFSTTQPS